MWGYIIVTAGGRNQALQSVAELDSHVCDVLTHVRRQIMHRLSVQLVFKFGAELTNGHGKEDLQSHT